VTKRWARSWRRLAEPGGKRSGFGMGVALPGVDQTEMTPDPPAAATARPAQGTLRLIPNVPGAGLEPARPYGQKILSLWKLPLCQYITAVDRFLICVDSTH
jgi:hypothetical protein